MAKTKYPSVELSEDQREDMFAHAYRQLIMCIKFKNPDDMLDRHLNSTFAFHMMRAEGRKECAALTHAHNRWIENNEDKLNKARADFRRWLRLLLAMEGESGVVDRDIAYLDPDKDKQ